MSIGDWEPLWLGTPSRRLYAAFHGTRTPSPAGVVLVPPLLHELPRSRRFLVQVASEFAALGLPCLRFDFHGTGDSGGCGTELDFTSMQHDLDLAITALRQQAGVARVALVAWRTSALALQGWVERGGLADLVVLWEPVVDGDAWLRDIAQCDAEERELRPPPRKGVPRATDPADGQLMGFPASRTLRGDLARTRMGTGILRGNAPVWGVVRADVDDLPPGIAKVLHLPANAPSFKGGAAMDATFFLTPEIREAVVDVGRAMRAEVQA
ncbi:hypothetical protein [Montanilutibacter psychrotolerans]|nr:hypothetical protein [Lysobacter psychrotolerans]